MLINLRNSHKSSWRRTNENNNNIKYKSSSLCRTIAIAIATDDARPNKTQFSLPILLDKNIMMTLMAIYILFHYTFIFSTFFADFSMAPMTEIISIFSFFFDKIFTTHKRAFICWLRVPPFGWGIISSAVAAMVRIAHKPTKKKHKMKLMADIKQAIFQHDCLAYCVSAALCKCKLCKCTVAP